MDREPTVVCVTCGVIAGADDPQVMTQWSRGSENGRTVWTCPACTRDHARAIEGKLDSAWW